MWSRFLYYLLQFKWVILVSMAAGIGTAFVLFLYIKSFAFSKRKNLTVITLFFGMSKGSMVYLAAGFLQLTFVLTAILFSLEMNISYLVYLLLLAVAGGIMIKEPVELLKGILGAVLLYASLFLLEMLRNYLFNMRFDLRIAIIACILLVFICVFALYFFLNTIHGIGKKY